MFVFLINKVLHRHAIKLYYYDQVLCTCDIFFEGVDEKGLKVTPYLHIGFQLPSMKKQKPFTTPALETT